MSEIPICSRCNKPHYNFTRCRVEKKPEPPLGAVLKSVPDGYRVSTGWGRPDNEWTDGPKAA